MITHDHEIIFVHIPKCAGRSINDVFNQRFDHFTARYYAKEYPAQWNNYTKFTIVRNPFARLVSTYTYIQRHRRHSNEAVAALIGPGRVVPSFKQWVKSNITAYNSGLTWPGKENTFTGSPEGMRGHDGDLGTPFWFTSQWQRIVSEDQVKTDLHKNDILKMESGMDTIGEYLSSLIGQNITIPHTNMSSDKDFHSFYDDETLALVKDFAPVAEDCKMLNYKFWHDDH